jgi:hypothetical protein
VRTDVSCRCSNAKKPEASRESEKPDLLLYHQLWRALFRGDNDIRHRRPPLPIELVDAVSRLAGFLVPDTTRTFECTSSVEIGSGGPFATKLWFCTQPLDLLASKQIAAMQLLTRSNDQGHADDPSAGSWTWFECGVFASLDEVTLLEKSGEGADGWKMSHRNLVAEGTPQDLKGPVLTVGNGISTELTEGCVFAVRACARFGAWRNYGHRAELRFWK